MEIYSWERQGKTVGILGGILCDESVGDKTSLEENLSMEAERMNPNLSLVS